MKKCPKCGKQLVEQKKWRGLWICPDYNTPINATAPFKYKCTGMHITKKGRESFDKAALLIFSSRN